MQKVVAQYIGFTSSRSQDLCIPIGNVCDIGKMELFHRRISTQALIAAASIPFDGTTDSLLQFDHGLVAEIVARG